MGNTERREQQRFDLGSMRMLVGGALSGSESGKVYDTLNPANGTAITQVPQGTAKDMEQAIAAADRAQPAWAGLSVPERAAYLRRLADEIERNAAEITRIEVIDSGNIIADIRRDVQNAINQLRYFAGLGYEIKGHTIPSTPANLHLTKRQPYGVVGRIIPFNHPFLFAVGKIAAPLMAGNAVVLKPSEQSPLTACCLAEMCAEIFPAGVINIVTGFGHDVGDALVCHPRVKRIAFTGSPETGMMIQRRAAENAVKAVSLELGGKNPMIIFPDADMDKAVLGAIKGMNFGWQGQSCGSTSRLFLHDSIHDAFLDRMVAKVRALRIGDPLDDSTEVGPMNNAAQLEKTEMFVERALADGARLLTGGRRPDGFDGGYWYEPTIFTEVALDSYLAQNEVFGPVLSVFRWSDVDEVIAAANNVRYGLTGSVWSRDISTALTTADRIESGYIWVNGVGPHYPATPFGGFKNSGIGTEESFSELMSYTQEQAGHVLL